MRQGAKAVTRFLVRAAVLLLALAQAPQALAHASLLRSEPAAGAVLARQPDQVRLVFNEPVMPLVIQLVGPQGHAVPLTRITTENAALAIALPPGLPRGTHLLSWRVASADGHPVGGSFVFSVGERSGGSAPPQLRADPRAQDALWTAKLVLYLGLFFGIGGVFHRAFVARTDAPRANAATLALLAAGLAAAVLSVGLQGLDALAAPLSALWDRGTWPAGFATSYGLTAMLAAAALMAGLAAGTIGVSMPGRVLAALALTGAGAALAASGHASAASPQMLTRPAVWLHAICVALWIGTLIPLALAMRGPYERRAHALEFFSRAAPLAVVLLVGTGTILAVIQLGSVEALWTTDYGSVLLGKLVFVALLLALAAMNRFVLTPQILGGDEKAPRRLIVSVSAEIVIAVVILALVASWRFTPPPRALAAAAEEPIFMHFHSEQAMTEFTIGPLRDGKRRIDLTVLNGEFAPLDAKEVTLVLSKPDAGIEPLRAPATPLGDNKWRIDDLEIPVPGRWRARFEILVNDFEKVSIEDDIEVPR
jgi:copper transport protein